MAKIACLLPKEAMIKQTRELIDKEDEKLFLVRQVDTDNCVETALKVVEEGAQVIVARGTQAHLIKIYTDIPVVEVILTAQELGRLIKRGMRLLNKQSPRVCMVGFQNMFCDTAYFEEIFDIVFKIYKVEDVAEIPRRVEAALADKMDLVIGGDVAVTSARLLGLPTLFLESTHDSIQEALRIAKTVSFARDMEKQSSAQISTILDTSFNGILKADANGAVLTSNRIMEEILGKKSGQLMGRHLDELLPELDAVYLKDVLAGRREAYSTFIKVRDVALMVMAAPVKVEEQIDGIILSFHKVRSAYQTESETLREMYLHGYVANYNFDQIKRKSRKMMACIDLAKRFTRSLNPVLIYGETGTEKDILAQSIHNNSIRRSGPFITVNCNGVPEDEQVEMLFGWDGDTQEKRREGALSLANRGTVLIHEIENLSLHCQYRLFKAIKYKALIQSNLERAAKIDVRIIVTTKRHLAVMVREGEFREDLFFALNGLTIDLPPLRDDAADVAELTNLFIKEYSQVYSRYVKMTKGARERMTAYSWPGNLIQLEAFCERLLLSADSHSISEDLVSHLQKSLYPAVGRAGDRDSVIVYKNPEAVLIAELLKKHGGNKNAVAKEMNISPTTLWRRMKKYDLGNRYDP